ncbi:MAG: hypothetical protein AAFP68_01415 [Pseudomonadota bacterium]
MALSIPGAARMGDPARAVLCAVEDMSNPICEIGAMPRARLQRSACAHNGSMTIRRDLNEGHEAARGAAGAPDILPDMVGEADQGLSRDYAGQRAIDDDIPDRLVVPRTQQQAVFEIINAPAGHAADAYTL